MRFVLRAIVFLALVGAVGLAAFAFLSDLPAPTREISQPVEVR